MDRPGTEPVRRALSRRSLIGLTLFCAASKLISNYSGLLPVTPSSRHNGVTSPISRQFLRRIFEASNVREPASDAALGLVPEGELNPQGTKYRRILRERG
jgi:hypothetical protein